MLQCFIIFVFTKVYLFCIYSCNLYAPLMCRLIPMMNARGKIVKVKYVQLKMKLSTKSSKGFHYWKQGRLEQLSRNSGCTKID